MCDRSDPKILLDPEPKEGSVEGFSRRVLKEGSVGGFLGGFFKRFL